MKRFAVFLYVVCIFIYIRANDSDSISLSLLEENQEDYVFCLYNNTQDTIYLFDGYFEKCYDGYIYTSMYVHRYDKKSKRYKLSLLPILPELRLSGCLNDRMITSKDKLIRGAQMTFTFTTIAPYDSLMVSIRTEAFQSLQYVNDIHPEKLSCFHHLLPKMKKKKLKQIPPKILFELGIYKNVYNLLKQCGEVSLDEVDKQATSMIVVSIPVIVDQ